MEKLPVEDEDNNNIGTRLESVKRFHQLVKILEFNKYIALVK